ncbi:MAG: 16S rRNA (cytidine(1402)-2'-O)-methyltransferase [Dehalococcoidia bacterium]
MPALYIVGTPLGNLEDITLRALRILQEVSLIAAEDTRTTRKLLRRYGVNTPLTSYHEHNKARKTREILQTLEKGDVALVSEAGMPTISDPGYELVVAAIQRGIPVVPVPGPSAITTALAASGLPSDQFLYLGFLPRRKAQRAALLRSVAAQPRTLVAFEAPHRLRASLKDILAALGNRRLAVCRELTKRYEEVFRDTVSQALSHFAQPRGEFTLVIEGAPKEVAGPATRAWASKELGRLKQDRVPAREAVARVVQGSGLPRREVYRLWLATPQ